MVLRTMTQFLSVMNDWIERIPLYPANIERKDAIMIPCRFETLEIGRPHGKAKNRTENPASKRTNPTSSHMALFLSTEAANWHQSQSTREKRIQRKHDEEIGEYLNCSRRRRQPDPLLGWSSLHCAHRSSIGREGSACKALRESHCSRLKPERRSWCAKGRQARPPFKSRLDWI